MSTPTRRALQELLESQPQAWHRDELVERFSRHSLSRLLNEGVAVRILPAVYVARASQNSFEARISAVGRWAPKGLSVTGLAGARLWLMTKQKPQRIDVICRQPLHLTGPAWLRFHTTTINSQSFIVGGVPVQDPADVTLRAWGTLGREAAQSSVIDAIRSGRVKAREVLERQQLYPRLKGRHELIKLLRLLAQGVDSYLEYLAATTVFNTPEFKGFERQARVDAGGRRYILDMLDKATQVAVELDGSAYHSSAAARRNDIERDANVSSIGILTLRFTFEDITRRPEWCRDKVRRTLASRRTAL